MKTECQTDLWKCAVINCCFLQNLVKKGFVVIKVEFFSGFDVQNVRSTWYFPYILPSFITIIFPSLYREGSARGFGIRIIQSSEGSDSWVDDPITRHIIGLHVKKEEGDSVFLWPLILHIKSHYSILVLPFVEPRHTKQYASLCRRSDCGSAIGVESSLSSLLLDLPSITG